MNPGFLLKTRPIEDSINIDVLEKSHNIKLPPIFREFVKTFYLDKIEYDKLLDKDKVNDYGTLNLNSLVYQINPDIAFHDFTSIEKALKYWKERNYDPFFYEKKIFPFGNTSWDFSICVGLEGKLKDKIIIDSYSADDSSSIEEGFKVICDNIFEFVRGLALIELNSAWGTSYSKLYKNWGEDFWRIRGQGS